MVWWVQARQLKETGKWNMVANSDEGGGFHELCTCGHNTAADAQNCPIAHANEGPITGIPHIDTLAIVKIDKCREQIADLILKDPDGNQLVVVSTLDKNDDGSASFTVGEDRPDGVRYRVTVKIEEV